MKYLGFQVVPLVFAVSATSAFAAGQEPSATRPNVVFILADDLGWADTTPYGSTFHETPNLERLARRAVRLTNWYAASPLCSPTRSSILTGLYPARTGITAPVCHLPRVQLEKRLAPANPLQPVRQADSLTRLKGEYVTTAELFKAAGYATAHFGKWHLGHGDGYEPKDQGFDVDIPHTPNVPGPSGGYFAPWKFVRDPKLQGRDGEHIDEWMARKAAAFIAERKGSPFYLNFWLYSVHGPWNSQQALIDVFQKKAVDPKLPQRNPLYAAMLKSMDNAVGTLLDALETAKVAENTIVIFTSDNGGFAYPPRATDPKGYDGIPATSNAPFRSGKASNYEGGTRVPCLIAWPGRIQPGTTNDLLFSSVDFLPTLLAMTGVTPRDLPRIDGVNQLPAILDGQPCRETVYVHFPHGGPGPERGIPGFWPATWVRKGNWKLIRFYAKNADRTDRLELYDLGSDPGETQDRAADRPEIVKELSGLIAAFLESTEAVVPTANAKSKASAAVVREWTPSQDATLDTQDGALVITSTGGDPFLTTRGLPATGTGPYVVAFEMKSMSRGPGRIFWMTQADPAPSRNRSAAFTAQHDGAWHSHEVRLDTEQTLTGLRIDPSTAPGEVQLKALRLKSRDGNITKAWSFGVEPQ